MDRIAQTSAEPFGNAEGKKAAPLRIRKAEVVQYRQAWTPAENIFARSMPASAASPHIPFPLYGCLRPDTTASLLPTSGIMDIPLHCTIRTQASAYPPVTHCHLSCPYRQVRVESRRQPLGKPELFSRHFHQSWLRCGSRPRIYLSNQPGFRFDQQFCGQTNNRLPRNSLPSPACTPAISHLYDLQDSCSRQAEFAAGGFCYSCFLPPTLRRSSLD